MAMKHLKSAHVSTIQKVDFSVIFVGGIGALTRYKFIICIITH